MKERLLEFMQHSGVTAGRLAGIIGVQPSAISHILSGRNKPGYEFISNLAINFPELNMKWLLTGEGNMIGSISQSKPSFENTERELFDNNNSVKPLDADLCKKSYEPTNQEYGQHDSVQTVLPSLSIKEEGLINKNKIEGKQIDKIIIFYKDGTYDLYMK